MRISEEQYPNIIKALRLIDHDNGAINRLEPDGATRRLSKTRPAMLREAEEALGRLTEEELGVLATGEFREQMAIASRTPELGTANWVLDRYLDGGGR